MRNDVTWPSWRVEERDVSGQTDFSCGAQASHCSDDREQLFIGGLCHAACGILFPNQVSNPHLLDWKHGGLTTGRSREIPKVLINF